jgi:hypothetical protein
MRNKWTSITVGALLLGGLSGVAVARDDVQFGFYVDSPGYYAPQVYDAPRAYYYGDRERDFRYRDRDRYNASREDRFERRGEWRERHWRDAHRAEG